MTHACATMENIRNAWLCMILFSLLAPNVETAGNVCVCPNNAECDKTKLVAAGMCHKENVALGQTARMNEQFSGSGPACIAINGNINRDYLADNDHGGPSCIHSNENRGWWQVDLGRNYTISSIVVYGRTNFPERMPTIITVNGLPCFQSEKQQNVSLTINITDIVFGRFVNLSITTDYLNVCQVQVWAQRCSCISDNASQCVSKESCSMENAALGKEAYMSSVKDANKACVAVDGDEGLTANSSLPSRNCVVSDDNDDFPWWEVDLGQKYAIKAITVYTTSEFMRKLTGVQISVDRQTCYNFSTSLDPLLITNVKCYQPLEGQHLTFNAIAKIQLVLCEVQIWVCKSGFYGDNCTERCGKCNNSTCNAEDGTCTGGCQSDFVGTLCKECKSGYFNGSACAPCGHCNNSICNNLTGICELGCETGWHMPNCVACEIGFYGQNCNKTCGHCLNISECDQVTGKCDGRCVQGFAGEMCKDCDYGYYYSGSTCIPCGQCMNDTPCNNVIGNCSHCKTGWQLPMCRECDSMYYEDGTKCEPCGHCINGTTCNSKNGSCPGGCQTGWQQPMCTLSSNIADDPSGVSVGGIAGGLFAVVVVIAALFVVILIRRRHLHRKKNSESQAMTMENRFERTSQPSNTKFKFSSISSQAEKPRAAVKPQTCTSRRGSDDSEVHVYSNSAKGASPMYGNIPTQDNVLEESLTISSLKRTSQKHDTNFSTVLENSTEKHSNANSRNTIYENIALVKSEQPVIPPQPVFRQATTSDTINDNDVVLEDGDIIYNNEDVYATFKPQDSVGLTDSLQRSLLASLASGELSKLFHDLPIPMEHPHTAGIKKENLRKNRFKSLCPYDHTRVILQRTEEETDTDYINASYIHGYERERTYIAAQGPRENTVDDMWLMVWQENVTQIVMLTKLKEDGKDKCAEYWPATGTTQTYGHVIVTGAAEEPRADFVIRTFSLKLQGKPFMRQVEQYQYLAWPDHGIPAAPSLVNFWYYVKFRALCTVPLLIHCSAGIGRSGTYIALDVAMEMIAHGRNVNVHKIVTDLREDRSSMVQSESQYKFLYEVILEACTSRSTRINLEQFKIKATGPINIHEPNHVIDKEFKMLQLMGGFVPKRSFNMATESENLGKNRNKDMLPDDRHLAYLSAPIQGRNMFINAVFLSSFKHQNGILLTQLPLPDTLVDTWCLIDDKNVNTIVSFGSKNDSKLVENYCQYWPKTAGDKLTTGPYTIEMTSSTVMNEHLISYQLSLKKQVKTREIRLFHYTNWVSDVPDETSCLLQLIERLHECGSDKSDKPILVQCIDGAAKSGLFCVLWEVISRMSCDQEIDVYLSARHVQSVRPQAVTSEVQYRYCYKVAQDFQGQFGVYQNTYTETRRGV